MRTFNFATETVESLNNQGVTQLDFCREFAGKDVTAQEIQEDVFELTGAEVRYARLTNGDTVYTDHLAEIGA